MKCKDVLWKILFLEVKAHLQTKIQNIGWNSENIQIGDHSNDNLYKVYENCGSKQLYAQNNIATNNLVKIFFNNTNLLAQSTCRINIRR